MARPNEVLVAQERPIAPWVEPLRLPLLGWSWLLLNILLIWLGIKVGYPLIAAVLTGGMNGTVISVIAVPKLSQKFQASATGFLAGVGLNRLTGEANLLSMAADRLHCFIDDFLDGFDGGSCAVADNPLHAQIEAAALQVVWTTVFVVLAALIAEWVRTARTRTRKGPVVSTTSSLKIRL